MKVKYKNYLLACLLLICGITPLQAQDARSILDNTSSKLRSAGGISAKFNVAMFKNKKAESSASGTIDISGKMVKMQTSAGTTWYNGKTRWVLQHGSDEAYISYPTVEEQQAMNPYGFLNLYKTGYKLSTKNVTYAGQPAYEVQMKAQNQRSSISEMLVTISKTSHMPLCIRFKQSSRKWVRIQVNGVSVGHKWNESHFTFNQKDHPKVEVVDLR